jgi:A/G-specific adenine glycosylase
LIEAFPAPLALAAADIEVIRQLIRPLGLQQRAETLSKLAHALVDQFGGSVPSDPQSLKSLPGVGDYISAAVRSCCFGQAAPMVDSLTARIYKRYFGLPGRADVVDKAVASVAIRELPRNTDAALAFNFAVIDLAATVCKAVKPRCAHCPLSDRCLSTGLTYSRDTWRQGAKL